MKGLHRQEGFTLIELIIVILIIGILVGIAVPVFLAARGSADEKACLSNQRNFLSAADIFASETGDYPNTAPIAAGYVGSAGRSTGIWPTAYWDGTWNGNVPDCPGTGTVTMSYVNTTTRPGITCSVHGGP